MAKNKEIHEIIEDAIDSHPAFGDLLLAEEKQTFIDYGVVHSAVAGEVLCRQGENDRRVFILIMGEVEVSEGEGEDKVVLSHLKRGEIFGEISALFESERISNVIVTKPGVFLILPDCIFEKVISGRPELHAAILERYKQRLSETALRNVGLFRYVDKSSLQSLIDYSSLISVPENQIIINEGEAGDYFYILINGVARVSRRYLNRSINLALIHPGDYFGEWSILTGAPRAASVSAVGRVDVLRIERAAILHFIQQQPDVAEGMDLVAHNRHDRLNGPSIPDSVEQVEQRVRELEDVLQQSDPNNNVNYH